MQNLKKSKKLTFIWKNLLVTYFLFFRTVQLLITSFVKHFSLLCNYKKTCKRNLRCFMVWSLIKFCGVFPFSNIIKLRKVELVQLNFQRSVLPEEYYMWHFTSWYFDFSPLAGLVVVLCIYIILKTSLDIYQNLVVYIVDGNNRYWIEL